MGRNSISLRKGDSPVEIRGRSYIVDLDWAFGADLELGMMGWGRDGVEALVWSQNDGARAKWPFMKLTHESVGKGRLKTRREHAVITRINEHERLFILVWDEEAAARGDAADFAKDSDSYRIRVFDQRNQIITFEPESHDQENCLVVAEIKEGSIRPIELSTRLRGKEGREKQLRSLVERAK